MKGMAIETIGLILIALFGVSLLIIFVSGSLTDLGRNVFCYFYKKVFSQNTDLCKPTENIPEQITVRPKSSEDLARTIAAYSILCWEDSTESLRTLDTTCYNILIKDNPVSISVDEVVVTEILLNEGGCSRLENDDVNPDCGEHNELSWEVTGDYITDQKLILIKYDSSTKQIIVRG